MRTGVIVAGGRSTRFEGVDKAVAVLAGVPMVRRVADRLPVDELVVNCRTDQRSAIRSALEGYPNPVRIAEDETPDRGPTAGIRTGLRAARSEYAVVVACDMPFVDSDFFAYLFERAAGRDAAVPRRGEYFEPMHAVYRAEAMADACDAALEGGTPRVVEPLFEVDYVVVDDDEIEARADPSTFENVNTREEFEAAEARL